MRRLPMMGGKEAQRRRKFIYAIIKDFIQKEYKGKMIPCHVESRNLYHALVYYAKENKLNMYKSRTKLYKYIREYINKMPEEV